jgi:hypothetical protein
MAKEKGELKVAEVLIYQHRSICYLPPTSILVIVMVAATTIIDPRMAQNGLRKGCPRANWCIRKKIVNIN